MNDSEAAREVWRSSARAAFARVRFFMLDPPDQHEQRRLLVRERGLTHVPEPTWDEVERRAEGYEPWQEEVARLDSSADIDALIAAVIGATSDKDADRGCALRA